MGFSRILLCGLAACATSTGLDDPSGTPPSSSTETTPPQGPQHVPGSPIATRLTQTDDDAPMAESLSVACSDQTGTLENSWYRVFALEPQHFKNPKFAVTRVNFAVQSAQGAQRVKVMIGTYGGQVGDAELDLAKIDVLGMTTIAVPETVRGETLQANFAGLEVPAKANLVVEVRTEGHSPTNGSYFYLGATAGAEVTPGYLRAPSCGFPNPVATPTLGYAQSHLIVVVAGTN